MKLGWNVGSVKHMIQSIKIAHVDNYFYTNILLELNF